MKKFYSLFIVILILLLQISSLNSQEIEENKVYVTKIKGEVEVGKINKNANIGSSTLGEGWFIRTGKKSSAVLFVNDLVVTVKENSRIEITKTDEKVTRFNLIYGSINVDSRQIYDEKEVVVDASGNTIKTEEKSTIFELTFDKDSNNIGYDVKQGSISITTDEVKIYINDKGTIKEEKNNKIENSDTPKYKDLPTINDNEIEDKSNLYQDENGVIHKENEENNKDFEINDLELTNEIENETGETIDEEPQSLSDVVSEETLDELKDIGMEINDGLNPPNIEGLYDVDDLLLVYDSKVPPFYFDPGYIMKNYIYNFYDQEGDKIKVKYVVKDNPNVYGGGDGAFITGSGQYFTIYLRIKSKLTGAYLSTLQIISGKVTEEGIENLKIALIIMGKEGADVHNIQMSDFPPIGTKRLIIARNIALRIK